MSNGKLQEHFRLNGQPTCMHWLDMVTNNGNMKNQKHEKRHHERVITHELCEHNISNMQFARAYNKIQ